MGRVYLARDTALGREVAVKLLAPEIALETEARARFLREARVMATLEHPHIVRIYSAGEHDGQPYFVMEYVTGESLARRLWRSKQLPVDSAVRVVHECVEALQAAWSHGIIHRDIKPSNIILDEHDTVRVVDFGLAKPTRWQEEITLPEAGLLICTPNYVSPEQAKGATRLDFRADIYSLGIVLFEMLTGDKPFRGGGPMAVVVRAVSSPMPDVRSRRPDVPEEVAGLLEWMTRKKPDHRPGSYEELAERLTRLRQGEQESISDLTDGDRPVAPAFLDVSEPEPAPKSLGFVGREREIAQLDRSLQQALRGKGRIIFVTGESGTGKTFLVDEFARRASAAIGDLAVISTSCVVRGEADAPFGPMRELLSMVTGDLESRWSAGLLSREQARRLWDLLPPVAAGLAELCPDLLGTLIDPQEVAGRAALAAPGGTPWRERLRSAADRAAERSHCPAAPPAAVFEQYERLLTHLAAEHPLLVLIDDLHWADPASINLLRHIGQRITDLRLLIVGVYRPSETTPDAAGGRNGLAELCDELTRSLGDNEVGLDSAGDQAFVDALIDREPNRLDKRFREQLFARTGGHALFTAEFLRGLQEQGTLSPDQDGYWTVTDRLDWRRLPLRVDAVIRQRLARLPARLRDLLAAASIDGEVFAAEVVARLVGSPPLEVVRQLGEQLGRELRLVRPVGVRSVGDGRISEYRFRHALFQQHLYNLHDQAERVYFHDAAGMALEETSHGATDAVAARLARHFRLSGRVAKAVEYYCRAGARATAMSAHEEALVFYRKADGMLARQPESTERDRGELTILLARIPPLLAARGWISREIWETLERAELLARALGDEAALSDLKSVAAMSHATSLQVGAALACSREALEMAQRTGEPERIASSRVCLGMNLFYAGELVAARGALEEILADPLWQRSSSPTPGPAGIDVYAVTHSWLGHTLRLLGEFEQAERSYRSGVSRAEDLDDPHALVLCRMHWGISLLEHRQLELAARNIKEMRRLIADRTLQIYSPVVILEEGLLLAKQGRPREALSRIELSHEQSCQQGYGGLETSFILRDTAETLLQAGMLDQGEQVIDGAIAAVESTGERYVEPELHRVKAALVLSRGGAGAGAVAERSLETAVGIARRQQSLSWELRAAMALGRFRQEQGNAEQARQLLSEVLVRFTGGQDFHDLEQARDLIESWSDS